MWRAIFAAVLVLASLGFAQPLEPETLLSELLSRYAALETFTATLTISLKFWERTVSQQWKIWYSEPFARIEREAAEDLPVLEIHDYESLRRWLLLSPNYWEKEEIQTKPEPLPLHLLDLAFVSTFKPSSLKEGMKNGKEVWVLEGPYEVWTATIWVDKKTFFIIEAELSGKAVTKTVRVEEFEPNVNLAQNLFQKPHEEEIAAVFRLSSEGMRIISEIQERFGALRSFVVRKSVEHAKIREEEIVFWRQPFLRVERRSPPSPWFERQIFWVEIIDFSQGAVYTNYGEGWEKMELPLDYSASPEITAMLVLASAFGLLPDTRITAVSEELLGGRKVWRLTGRGEPGAPPSEWWVDQETFLVLQYTMPFRIKYVGEEEWHWEVEKVRITSFETDVEIPDEVFAVPKDVPVQRPRWIEPEEPGEQIEPGPGLTWEPFSFARLEEASGTVVLFFTADWCEPCHLLEEGPLRDPRVTELLAPLVRLKVDLSDLTNAESRRASDVFKVRELPTLLFLGPDGKELGRITGFRGTSFFLSEIKRILSGGER